MDIQYQSFRELQEHSKSLQNEHLRQLLSQEERNNQLFFEQNGIVLDLSHEKINNNTIDIFQKLADESQLFQKITDMFSGVRINSTENRAVLHTALRSPKGVPIILDGQDISVDIHDVLQKIQEFSNKIRDGQIKGFSQKSLKNLVIIGIGGSYLGIEFVYEALCNAVNSGDGRSLYFIANVDPINFSKVVKDLNHEETLFLVNSKTFTTAETMMNARTCKNWLLEQYKKQGINVDANEIVSHHMCACSTNLDATSKFGISPENVFGFWDWVGGRYSVCSAIGVLPLSIQFGYDVVEQFLKGAHNVDVQFQNTDLRKNLPVLLGMIGFLHTSVQNYDSRALLPYCQALNKFAPHIQQVDMESNGKRVNKNGDVLGYQTGPVNFGEPGTNGQHSFYQLLHQGRTIPCEFIGFVKSQTPIILEGEVVSNHDELMSNFFSQPDALACGKTVEELNSEQCAQNLISHKTFPGDRPSLSILFEKLDPFTCGQLLALYEHRTAVEGFLWNVNSFDQYGVELGKQLATQVRTFFKNNSSQQTNFDGFNFNSATKKLLEKYQNLK